MVGAKPAPDVYEQPFPSLDVIGNYNLDSHWSLRLVAKNLAFQELRYTQGSVTRERFRPGTVITVGAAWNYGQ